MSVFLSLIFGAGLGTWVYDFTMKKTHRTDAASMLGAVTGIMGFIMFFVTYKFLFQHTEEDV